jgi:hypothetical protein
MKFTSQCDLYKQYSIIRAVNFIASKFSKFEPFQTELRHKMISSQPVVISLRGQRSEQFRSRAKLEKLRQSHPESGCGFQAKQLQTFKAFPFCSSKKNFVSSLELSGAQSMRLEYEPASEPLHISVKQLFSN